FCKNTSERGLTLGTSMAVSGAAMSPTSGHSTHSLKAFILGVLNARLGYWIDNPTAPGRQNSSSRAPTGLSVLWELLAVRSRFGHSIHLSDGGHFENLGIYELLRRGCRRIIAIDASCDPARDFQEFANTIRRAQIDLGIRVIR